MSICLLLVMYQDAASEICAELQGNPDLIIGNYSDGNLVASLLSYKMGVTQVIIMSRYLVLTISLICNKLV